jgi:hypothetical protein
MAGLTAIEVIDAGVTVMSDVATSPFTRAVMTTRPGTLAVATLPARITLELLVWKAAAAVTSAVVPSE